jgi:hypothetical protein
MPAEPAIRNIIFTPLNSGFRRNDNNGRSEFVQRLLSGTDQVSQSYSHHSDEFRNPDVPKKSMDSG